MFLWIAVTVDMGMMQEELKVPLQAKELVVPVSKAQKLGGILDLDAPESFQIVVRVVNDAKHCARELAKESRMGFEIITSTTEALRDETVRDRA